MPAQSTTDSSIRPGVLLVGHGTRSEQGRKQFLSLAEHIRQRLPLPVEPAFLELAEPTIEQAIQQLVAVGIDRLVVVPLLLFAAGHAKEDVPAAAARALQRHGATGLQIDQASPFGCHPLIVELACLRLAEAIGLAPSTSAEKTLLILVGRGSSDPTATAQMHEFARLVSQRAALRIVQVAFLAMAEPNVAAVLAAVDERAFDRVIVQPHLLFHGELVERLRRQVGQIARQRPDQEWIVTGVLADDLPKGGEATRLLVAATVDLIERELDHQDRDARLAPPAATP